MIAAMEPETAVVESAAMSNKPAQVVSNIRVRYTENFQTDEDVGSAVRTFLLEPIRASRPAGSWI